VNIFLLKIQEKQQILRFIDKIKDFTLKKSYFNIKLLIRQLNSMEVKFLEFIFFSLKDNRLFQLNIKEFLIYFFQFMEVLKYI